MDEQISEVKEAGTDWSALARRARQRDRIAWLRWDWWLVADRPPAPEPARPPGPALVDGPSAASGAMRSPRARSAAPRRRIIPALALALCAIGCLHSCAGLRPAFAQPSAPLPRAWAGGGAAYAVSVPPVSGWASYANLISQSGQIYSFTTHEITSNRETRPYTIQTSVRSGVAAVLRRFGPLTILGLGDVGLAGSGTSVGAAWSGGGVAILQLGKTDWTLLFMPIQSKSAVGGSQTGWRFGLGRKFD